MFITNVSVTSANKEGPGPNNLLSDGEALCQAKLADTFRVKPWAWDSMAAIPVMGRFSQEPECQGLLYMRSMQASLSCMPELLLENSDPFPARRDGSQRGDGYRGGRRSVLDETRSSPGPSPPGDPTAPLGRSLLKTLGSKGAQNNWSSKSLLAEFQY